MRATVSVMGLYEYDNSLFDNMEIPEGLDGDLVKESIILECAELELLYSDPFYLKGMIGVWSAAELPIWEKLYATTTLDYNPIWNKDGTITESETSHRLHKELGGDDETFRSEGSSSRDQSDTGNNTLKVSAYDTSDYSNREKNELSSTATEHVIADNENTTERDVDRDNMDADDRIYERRETGNIGVTTTQQMIKEEREVDQFNIVDYIVQSFKRRFCLLVY